MPLSPDEMALMQARAQALGWIQSPQVVNPGPQMPAPPDPAPPPAAPPPAAPAPPPAGGAPGPGYPSFYDRTPGQRPFAAGLDLSRMPPASLQNAHVAINPQSDKAIGADQTVGYQPPADAGANAPASPPPPTVSSSSATTIQKGTHFSPETMAGLRQQEAGAAEYGKLAEQGVAAKQQAAEAGAKSEAQVLRNNAMSAGFEQEQGQRALGEQRAGLERLISDVQNSKVDPDRYWNRKSTGEKIALVLASAAGGFAAGFTHTPNQVTSAIRSAIDDDINAQRADLETKRGAVAARSQLYEMARAEFKDKFQAHEAARAAAFTAAQKETEAAIARASTPLEQAKLVQVRNGLQQEALAARIKVDEASQDKITKHFASSTTSGGAGAAAGGGVPVDRVVRGPDGRMYMVNSADAAKNIQHAQAIASRLQRNIEKAKALRAANGQVPFTDARAQLEQATADIKRDYLALNEKLRPTGKGADFAEQAVGDPSSLFDFHGGARLDALQQSVKDSLADSYSAYGATPLSSGNVVSQNGRLLVQTPDVATVAPPRAGGKKR